jgi:hypothetical protein
MKASGVPPQTAGFAAKRDADDARAGTSSSSRELFPAVAER